MSSKLIIESLCKKVYNKLNNVNFIEVQKMRKPGKGKFFIVHSCHPSFHEDFNRLLWSSCVHATFSRAGEFRWSGYFFILFKFDCLCLNARRRFSCGLFFCPLMDTPETVDMNSLYRFHKPAAEMTGKAILASLEKQMLHLTLDNYGVAIAGETVGNRGSRTEVLHGVNMENPAVFPCDGGRLHVAGRVEYRADRDVDALWPLGSCECHKVSSSFRLGSEI